ncbi:uncharacterized protein LOC119981152 [Tripterygium wilfordii]|uniref:uncharacterized protein LOC119981115 n=1 Tax=Tripterygium wilfordii TaxID=458696 RepID=UPI0018F85455|nr:uncharacterized protein LOC119981115 [Tripterygium wilfordii]XP_038680124.1 uncharacterized protein LOC119981152 [Tripterygium wilfordii]
MGAISCQRDPDWVVSSTESILQNDNQTTVELEDEEERMRLFSGFNRTQERKMEEKTKNKKTKTKKKKNQVLLEGYVEVPSEDDLKRTKSLTDEDLDELKGCLDLGFGFSYDEIPELCNTLPALELCYSMSQRFHDEHHKSPETSGVSEPSSSPVPNWKISSPGDHPEEVKARLKYWAQAVACTVKLCS